MVAVTCVSVNSSGTACQTLTVVPQASVRCKRCPLPQRTSSLMLMSLTTVSAVLRVCTRPTLVIFIIYICTNGSNHQSDMAAPGPRIGTCARRHPRPSSSPARQERAVTLQSGGASGQNLIAGCIQGARIHIPKHRRELLRYP